MSNNHRDIPHYGIGTLVYWDSFAGMLKGKIVKFIPSQYGNKALIEITSTSNKAYMKGETIETYLDHVFPRECFHKSRKGTFYFYTTAYYWDNDNPVIQERHNRIVEDK